MIESSSSQPSPQPLIVRVRQQALKNNDVPARQPQREYTSAGALVVSFVSSPGAGHMALLEQTLRRLHRWMRYLSGRRSASGQVKAPRAEAAHVG